MKRRATAPRTERTAHLTRYRAFVAGIARRARRAGGREVLIALARHPYVLPSGLSKLSNGAALARRLMSLVAERRRLGVDRDLNERVRAIVTARLEAFGSTGHEEIAVLARSTGTLSRHSGKTTRTRGLVDLPGRASHPIAKLAKARKAAAKRQPKPSGARRGRRGVATRERAEPSMDLVLQHDITVGRPFTFNKPTSASAPGTLGGKASGRSPSSTGTPPVKPPTRGKKTASDQSPARWFSAEFEDHLPSEPLDPDTTYTIAFSVDATQNTSAVATTEFADKLVFSKGVKEVSLTVQLESDDFEIPERTRPLRVPRTGQSRGKARFDVTPLHAGRCSLYATLHKAGNFIQKLDITVSVGRAKAEPVAVEATGRPPSAAAVLQPRDIGLTIEPASPDGYTCTVRGSVAARAHLPIKEGELAAAVAALQAELLTIVNQQNDTGAFVFQSAIDIPVKSANSALRVLAQAGALFFQSLFYHPAAGPDAKRLGDWLRQMATNPKNRLTIQVVTLTTPIPWDLVYVGDASDTAVLDWDLFLGMRHIVEQIPLQNTLSIADSRIPSDDPTLAISVNINSTIDAQFGVSFVKDQTQYWKAAAARRNSLRVTPRTTAREVMQALGDAGTADQILYFYCHARSVGIGSGGPNTSSLELTDKEMTLGDLKRNAPTTVQLRGMPLVFINACESAELSPAFYDGFVPYFMAKGARGVVGTECQTPALFAARWHDRFFDVFLDGAPIGETFLLLRREFRERHNNPLGLLYAVHCDADTQIHPAVAASTR